MMSEKLLGVEKPSETSVPDMQKVLPGATFGDHTPLRTTMLYNVPISSLVIDGTERLCLAQISSTLLKAYSYNEIHNRRVALGITCVQCTPAQLNILRRAGAMPPSSRRCGMITGREAERLVKSFLDDVTPPHLPENFFFKVYHSCGWGCTGEFIPSRYNSSRAKCIRCLFCNTYFSPNKFIFHCHKTPLAKYTHPDAANFNSWRRHLKLSEEGLTQEIEHIWEDVKALFNGGTRKRISPWNEENESKSFDVPTKKPCLSDKDSTSSAPPTSRPCLVIPNLPVPPNLSHIGNLRSPFPPVLQPFWPGASSAELSKLGSLSPFMNFHPMVTPSMLSHLPFFMGKGNPCHIPASGHMMSKDEGKESPTSLKRPWVDGCGSRNMFPEDFSRSFKEATLLKGKFPHQAFRECFDNTYSKFKEAYTKNPMEAAHFLSQLQNKAAHLAHAAPTSHL